MNVELIIFLFIIFDILNIECFYFLRILIVILFKILFQFNLIIFYKKILKK